MSRNVLLREKRAGRMRVVGYDDDPFVSRWGGEYTLAMIRRILIKSGVTDPTDPDLDDICQEAAIKVWQGGKAEWAAMDWRRKHSEKTRSGKHYRPALGGISLNALRRDDDDESEEWINTIGGPDPAIERLTDDTDTLYKIRERCSPREQYVAIAVLNGIKSQDIAERIGISASRVSQVMRSVKNRVYGIKRPYDPLYATDSERDWKPPEAA